MKICVKCSKEKDCDQFSTCAKHKDGLQHHCKQCNKEYRTINSLRIKEKSQIYYQINDEAIKIRSKSWREANPVRYKEALKNYFTTNPHVRNFHSAKRRVAKKSGTLSWLNEDQVKQIKDLYWLAKDLFTVTGDYYEVDHIIPLQGSDVCGLHVPWNLQILPSDLNRSKHNTF